MPAATSQSQDNPRRPEPAIEIDHLGFLTDRPHRRAVLVGLRRLSRRRRGQLANLHVLHEADDSCCERQPWAQTMLAILQALAADGEGSVLVTPRGVVAMRPGEAG